MHAVSLSSRLLGVCKMSLTNMNMFYFIFSLMPGFFSMRTKSHEAHVRLPLCLVEPEYVSFLFAKEGAVRCLHRISFLNRLNFLVEEATDSIIDGKNDFTCSTRVFSHHYFQFLTYISIRIRGR